jgi:hypothetical protein
MRLEGSPRPPPPPPARSIGRTPGSEGELIADCRLALGEAGITAHEFARLTGVYLRTVHRWEANATRVPGHVWLALFLLFEGTELGKHIPVPDLGLLNRVRAATQRRAKLAGEARAG